MGFAACKTLARMLSVGIALSAWLAFFPPAGAAEPEPTSSADSPQAPDAEESETEGQPTAGDHESPPSHSDDREKIQAQPASYQRQPPSLPRLGLEPQTPLPPAAGRLQSWLAEEGLQPNLVTPAAGWFARDVVSGRDATLRASTDAGSILGDTPRVLGTGVQRRTPIITDPRVRGSRVGQLAASGSYWVPARIDLDTILSKIDSRIVDEVTVIKGPYSVRDGPGLDFVDVELLHSPRFEQLQGHGSTSFDFQANGQQWYGRQALWAGHQNWGARFSYGHRTGNDYLTGGGEEMFSGYKSRDMDLAFGLDPSPDTHVEFNGLRLDQTDVEYPGHIFDMNYLVADGYELSYVVENRQAFDRLVLDVWYNNTRFFGNAQQPGKRQQFPFLDFLRYEGFTDVMSMSSGYRMAVTWGQEDEGQFTAGADLRYLKQELNEIGSGRVGFVAFADANCPLPRSQFSNPGVFLEEAVPVTDRLRVTVGARGDFAGAEVIDDPQKLEHLGLQPAHLQYSLADVLGTNDFDRNFGTWAVFLTGDFEVAPHWHALFGAGHGERPPSLTELFVAQSFMFLIQNGENAVTGDPRLRPERASQLDLGLRCDYERWRGGIQGFHAWVQDYITFENLGVYEIGGHVEQVNLKYVNTDLATLAGAESYLEYDAASWITPFATLRYVEGRDQTRNGNFATIPVQPGDPDATPSYRDYGSVRGATSGVAGASEEPLPGILPLESRLGLRFHEPAPRARWAVELSARVVAAQDRVATSLLEAPSTGFTVWDVRGYWRATQRMLLVAGVENFTDKNYREHLDFRSPGGVSVFQPGINVYSGAELVY